MEPNPSTETIADTADGVRGVDPVSTNVTWMRGLKVDDTTPEWVLKEIADVLFKGGYEINQPDRFERVYHHS